MRSTVTQLFIKVLDAHLIDLALPIWDWRCRYGGYKAGKNRESLTCQIVVFQRWFGEANFWSTLTIVFFIFLYSTYAYEAAFNAK